MKINIKPILESKGKSVYWLAQNTGITYNHMLKICSHKTEGIRYDVLEKICQVLDCTPNDILQCEYDSDQSHQQE